MTSATFHGWSAGDQLGNLEYVVDDALLAEYLGLTGGAGQYPNLMADDCRALLARRCGVDLTTVWRRLELLRPPVIGRRVQVGGWLREIGQREGRPLLRVAAFAVDEIGTEILRSEAAFLAGRPGAQQPADASPAGDSGPVLQGFSDGMVGSGIDLGRFTLPDDDVAVGWSILVAGWLEGQLGRYYEDDFRWGGRLSLAYPVTARSGDVLVGDAVVVGCDRDAGGAETTRLVVSVVSRTAERIAVGEAIITSPSPRLL